MEDYLIFTVSGKTYKASGRLSTQNGSLVIIDAKGIVCTFGEGIWMRAERIKDNGDSSIFVIENITV